MTSNSSSRRSDMDHTNNTMPAFSLRSHSPDSASTDLWWQHQVAAYSSFIDPERMKGWVGLVVWPAADISGHPSAVGRAQDSESSPVKDQRSTAEPRTIRCCGCWMKLMRSLTSYHANGSYVVAAVSLSVCLSFLCYSVIRITHKRVPNIVDMGKGWPSGSD